MYFRAISRAVVVFLLASRVSGRPTNLQEQNEGHFMSQFRGIAVGFETLLALMGLWEERSVKKNMSSAAILTSIPSLSATRRPSRWRALVWGDVLSGARHLDLAAGAPGASRRAAPARGAAGGQRGGAAPSRRQGKEEAAVGAGAGAGAGAEGGGGGGGPRRRGARR